MVLIVKKEDYNKPEDGEYIAELVKIDEFKSPKNPSFGTSFKFQFKILEAPYTNTVVSGLAPSTLKPGNKLDNWLSALGLTSNIGETIDVESLVGRQVRIYIIVDEKSGYANVKMVKPLRSTDVARLPSITAASAAAVTANVATLASETLHVPTAAPVNPAPAPAAIPQATPVAPAPAATPRRSLPF